MVDNFFYLVADWRRKSEFGKLVLRRLGLILGSFLFFFAMLSVDKLVSELINLSDEQMSVVAYIIITITFFCMTALFTGTTLDIFSPSKNELLKKKRDICCEAGKLWSKTGGYALSKEWLRQLFPIFAALLVKIITYFLIFLLILPLVIFFVVAAHRIISFDIPKAIAIGFGAASFYFAMMFLVETKFFLGLGRD